MARPKVSIYLRIRQPDGKQPYCPAIWETKKSLKPHWCVVQRAPEHHPEGTYHLRYRVKGKRVWESVGDDPVAAVSLKDSRLFQLKHPHSQDGQRLAEMRKPERTHEAQIVPERLRIADEIKTYLSNCEKLAPKTYSAYKLTLTLFQKSFTKPYVDQVRKQDLQAFDTFLAKQGDDERTRSNRVGHVVSFLRNREGRREGEPITNVSITIKYVEAPPEPYTRQQLEDLFRVSCDEDKLLWRFFLGTGFREGEVSVAEYCDVNPDKKMIYVTEKAYFDFKPKDCEKRAVPISDERVTQLAAKKNGSSLIFGKDGNPDGHLLRRLKSVAFRGGLNCGKCIGTIDGKPVRCADAPVCQHWILHRFRKNFATDRHEAGASARKIQKWLGHESLETTLRYLASSEDTTDSVREICNSVHLGL